MLIIYTITWVRLSNNNNNTVQENDTQTPMGLWHTNGSPNLGQKTRSYNNQQKKKKRKRRKPAKLST